MEMIDFVLRHPVLFSLAGVLLVVILISEIRRKNATQFYVSPIKATAMINRSDAQIVDIRDKNAFNQGHIIDALHLPLSEIDKQKNLLDSERPAIIVCERGQTSMSAYNLLKDTMSENLFVLEGGLNAWKEAELPIVKS